jgi:transcriptional regulator of met regulon
LQERTTTIGQPSPDSPDKRKERKEERKRERKTKRRRRKMGLSPKTID